MIMNTVTRLIPEECSERGSTVFSTLILDGFVTKELGILPDQLNPSQPVLSDGEQC